MKLANAERLIERIKNWFELKENIKGLLLVGSYANGKAHPNSDIDLMILVEEISGWTKNLAWLEEFGSVDHNILEDWGAAQSVRCFYKDSFEVEFSFAPKSWASIDPIDEGSKKVISNGAVILYDPFNYFKKMLSYLEA